METRKATGRVVYPWEKCSIIAESEGLGGRESDRIRWSGSCQALRFTPIALRRLVCGFREPMRIA
ncbi:hypothetical protein GCM10009830_06290 [Glycomyces endophyticus]|uniref:Transposase n=1 Tax=Glycomyces endophyticus TaxID=480996 RepID=A0ABN2G1A0_9ACTN